MDTETGDAVKRRLRASSEWAALPQGFIDALAERIHRPEVAEWIVTVIDRFNTLRPIRPVIESGAYDTAMVLLASSVCEIANKLGTSGNFASAKQIAVLALQIEPNHFPAHMTLAEASFNDGDLSTAKSTCEFLLAVNVERVGDPEVRKVLIQAQSWSRGLLERITAVS